MKTNRPQQPRFEIDYNNFTNATQIQNFINKQLWVSGGRFNSDTAQTVTTTVKWGGQSRFLAGFNFFCNNPQSHVLTITLNNEKVIDSAPLVFLQPLGNIRFIQYFEFIRPLSGSDVLVFSTVSTVAEEIQFGVYMTRAYNKYYTRD